LVARKVIIVGKNYTVVERESPLQKGGGGQRTSPGSEQRENRPCLQGKRGKKSKGTSLGKPK